jgi:hypothetical protein
LTVPVGSALIAADRDYDVKNNCNVVKVSIHPDQTESSHANDDLLKNSLNSQFYQIELCRQDAIGYPRPSPAISQTMRRGPQIKYHEQSAESLQSMQWRRVLVGYKKMWWFPQTYIHHSILGKSARPISSLTGHGGKELADILAIILWRDYHSVVENNRPIKVQPF